MPKLGRTLLNGLGLAGGLALFNLSQDLRAGPLMSELPGRANFWRSSQGTIFYKVLGEGEPLVLIHGFNAAASSYELRKQVGPLAEHFQVYAFDWLGFGLSERPPLVYTPGVYLPLLDEFMASVVGRPAGVIASSLAGAYVIHNAAHRPDLYRRLMLSLPTGIDSLAGEPNELQAALRTVFASPVLGAALFNLLASPPSLRYFLEGMTYYDPAHVTDAMIGAYYAASHQPGARHAPASFISNHLSLDIREAWSTLAQPTLLVWGRDATTTPLSDVDAFLALKPSARLEVFDRCRLLPHGEHADRFNALAVDFFHA